MGRRWTEQERKLITEMYTENRSMEKIADKLPGRTLAAVHQQAKRLGLKRGSIVPPKENFFVPPIDAEDYMSREEALKILSTAIKHLQKGGELREGEIRRLRAVATLVRSYFSVYDSYERYAELEERMEELETFVRQEAEKTQKKTQQPEPSSP